MDYIIELIINAIVAAFRDRTPRPTKPLAPIPRPQSPKANRVIARPPQRRPVRQQVTSQFPPRPRPETVATAQRSPKSAPPARPVPAKPAPKPAAPTPPAAAPLSGVAIGQLIRSRPAALRSVIVLSEILQPPLALR